MNSSTFSSETGQKPEMNEASAPQMTHPVREGADAVQAETVMIDHGGVNSVQGGTINIMRGGANTVQGDTVHIEQGGATSVTADHLTVRQGGVVKAEVRQLEMFQGGIVLAKTETAHLSAMSAAVVQAQGEVKMEQSWARALLASGNVSMNQSGAVVMFARDVKAEKSGVTFLFARKVEGSVAAMFGPRESVLFGLVAGLAAGLVLLVSKQLKLRRRAR
jgi:hypothetical protein